MGKAKMGKAKMERAKAEKASRSLVKSRSALNVLQFYTSRITYYTILSCRLFDCDCVL